MIFQEPMTSLNGVYTIGWQLMETMKVHGVAQGEEARARSVALLDRVRIPGAAQIMRQYPHELSGGMRQRVMIAMALANGPKLLIADEPTTALDVTVQAQILDLMRDLQQEMGMAILLITHDLGIVAKMANHVVVMYAGQVVESAPTSTLFRDPQHPTRRGCSQAFHRVVIVGVICTHLRVPCHRLRTGPLLAALSRDASITGALAQQNRRLLWQRGRNIRFAVIYTTPPSKIAPPKQLLTASWALHLQSLPQRTQRRLSHERRNASAASLRAQSEKVLQDANAAVSAADLYEGGRRRKL